MAIFNRKSNDQIPSELEQYYDGPKWRVWVRRAVYVVLVIIVLAGIFLLGRAVYRSMTGADENNNDTAQTQEEKNKDNKNQSNNNDTQNGQAGGQNNGAQNTQGGQTGGQPSGQGGANTQAPNAIPRTGDDPDGQPHTDTLPATGG